MWQTDRGTATRRWADLGVGCEDWRRLLRYWLPIFGGHVRLFIPVRVSATLCSRRGYDLRTSRNRWRLRGALNSLLHFRSTSYDTCSSRWSNSVDDLVPRWWDACARCAVRDCPTRSTRWSDGDEICDVETRLVTAFGIFMIRCAIATLYAFTISSVFSS
jgi:hypothetical protein